MITLIICIVTMPMASAWLADWLVRVRPAKEALKIVKPQQLWIDENGRKWRIVGVCRYTFSVAFCLDELGADKGLLISPPDYITKYHTRVE